MAFIMQNNNYESFRKPASAAVQVLAVCLRVGHIDIVLDDGISRVDVKVVGL